MERRKTLWVRTGKSVSREPRTPQARGSEMKRVVREIYPDNHCFEAATATAEQGRRLPDILQNVGDVRCELDRVYAL